MGGFFDRSGLLLFQQADINDHGTNNPFTRAAAGDSGRSGLTREKVSWKEGKAVLMVSKRSGNQ